MSWIKIEKGLFTLLIGAVLAAGLQVARDWPLRASIIILVLGTIGLALVALQAIADFKSAAAGQTAGALTMETPVAVSEGRWGSLEIWGWVLGFFAAIYGVGFLAAVPLFVFAYTKSYGSRWVLAVVLSFLCWGFVYCLFDVLLHVPWPEPWLFSLLG